MRLTFLGTGTSSGVPMIGCDCEVCCSDAGPNHRTRSSVLIEFPEGNLLIDTSPELRLQLLREGIGRVDAVLFTHYHADHIYGLDDLRVFPKVLGRPVPVYAEPEVQQVLRQAFPYVFDEATRHLPAGMLPQLELHTLSGEQPFEILGQHCVPIRLFHGRFQVLGFRFGDLAYCTDVKEIPPQSMDLLQGLEVLVLDALRERPHPTHLSVDESLELVRELRPRRTYFTHVSHELDHVATNQRLPTGVELTYDGLTVESS